MGGKIHIHVAGGDSSLDVWSRLGRAGRRSPEDTLRELLPGSVEMHYHTAPRARAVSRTTGDAQRLLDTLSSSNGKVVAKLYRDTEWEEFIVKLWVGGVYQSNADYHTDDKGDAQSTMKDMVRRAAAHDSGCGCTKCLTAADALPERAGARVRVSAGGGVEGGVYTSRMDERGTFLVWANSASSMPLRHAFMQRLHEQGRVETL